MVPDTLERRATLALRDPALFRQQCFVDGRWTDAEALRRDTLARRRKDEKPDSPLLAGDLASIRIEAHRHPAHIAPKIVVSLGRVAERCFE